MAFSLFPAEMVCDDPGTPDDGHRILRYLAIDSVVTYRCNPGYLLVGPEQRTCVLPEGSNSPSWTHAVPACTSKGVRVILIKKSTLMEILCCQKKEEIIND